MGQRLNVEVHYDGEVLANAYYHWSAYTGSALNILKEVIDAYRKCKEISPLKIAVEILQATGAGVDNEEKCLIAADRSGKFDGINFREAASRNDGLLSVTKNGIEDTRKWEEGRVTVDIGSETFLFDVMWSMGREDYEDSDNRSFDEIPYIEFDFDKPCHFKDYDKMAKVIWGNPDGVRINEDAALIWIA